MAIARDGGSSFPILASNTGAFSSITTGTFSTSNATTNIIVRFAWGNVDGTSDAPFTVAWNGGTPAGASTFTRMVGGNATANSAENAEIWTANCTSTLSAVSVTVTAASSSTNANAQVAVDAITGYATDQSTALTGSTASASGSSVARNITLNSVQNGSWIFWGAFSETGPMSPVANSNENAESVSASPSYAAVGDNTTGTSGSVNVGEASSAAWSAAAALEVLVIGVVTAIESESLGTTESQDSYKLYTPYTFFQQDAFQSNAFAILGGTTGSVGPSGSETDTLGISDAQSSKQVQLSSESDVLGLSDPQAAAKGATATQSDTLGFGESQASSAGKASSESDTLGFSDPQDATVGGGGTFSASETDTLGFSDSQDASAGKAASETDTLGFSDAQASAAGKSSSETDTLGFSDVQAAASGKAASQTDTLGFSDGQDSVIGKAVTLQDALGMADAYAAAISGGTTFSGSETDTLGFGDGYAAAIAIISKAEQDTLGLGDSYAAAKSGGGGLRQRFHVWSGTGWV